MLKPVLGCIGYGYVAQVFARAWQQLYPHGTVLGTKRAPAPELWLHVFNGEKQIENAAQIIPKITHLLISVPPGPNGDRFLRLHANLLRPKWVGLLSTTGVYGNTNGEWVDENSPLLATNPESLARINAEQEWQASDLPLQIFRLGAIYGPGRNIFNQFINNTVQSIEKPNQYFSRIHVDDIAASLIAGIKSAVFGRCYNLVDDLPTPQTAVIEYAAKLLGVPAPARIPLAEAILSPAMQRFYQSSRRVRNQLLKSALGVSLSYPTYREGLLALHKSVNCSIK